MFLNLTVYRLTVIFTMLTIIFQNIGDLANTHYECGNKIVDVFGLPCDDNSIRIAYSLRGDECSRFLLSVKDMCALYRGLIKNLFYAQKPVRAGKVDERYFSSCISQLRRAAAQMERDKQHPRSHYAKRKML